MFPFEASVDGFLRSNCTSLEQEYILIQSREEYILLQQVQPEVGMDDGNNATTSQVAAREECETTNLPAARDDSVVNRSKQAVR